MGGVSSEKSCPHREQGGDAHRPCGPKVPPAYSLQPIRQFGDFSFFVCARLGSAQVPHCGCEPAYRGNTPRDQCCRLDERSHHPPLIIPEGWRSYCQSRLSHCLARFRPGLTPTHDDFLHAAGVPGTNCPRFTAAAPSSLAVPQNGPERPRNGSAAVKVWRRGAVSRPLERSSFSTTDSHRPLRRRLDVDSQPACKTHRDQCSEDVQNAKQGSANSENSQRTGVAPAGPCTCVPKRCELLRATR
jgi:hypothetical protein